MGKEFSEAIRVAVASEDGVVIQQHFGRASRFLIYEIVGAEFRRVEIRENQPACGTGESEDGQHAEDPMRRSVELVADCRAVLAARIGPGAVGKLAERGVLAFVIPGFIDDSLKRLIASGQLQDVPQGEPQKFFRYLPTAADSI